jgi:hypothetical protein
VNGTIQSSGWTVIGMNSTTGRRDCNSVILPDGKVLAIGGQGLNDDPNLSCEMFDPADSSWTTMDDLAIRRGHHSFALLLPDGRVFVTGHENTGELQEKNYEIYYPPYLFSGSNTWADRDTIEVAPNPSSETVHYGLPFEITMNSSAAAAAVDEVVLMRPSAVTHATDFSQSRVLLSHAVVPEDPARLVVSGPKDSTYAPPGYYMLFAVGGGVPTEARWVKVGGGASYTVAQGDSALWGGDVWLEESFEVESGGKLRILPGTTVRANANATTPVRVLVQGQALAEGTSQAPIKFTTFGGNGSAGEWRGFSILGSDGSSDLTHCEFEHAEFAVEVDSLACTLFEPKFSNSETADIYSDGDVVIQPSQSWDLVAPTLVVFEADNSAVDSPLGEGGICDLLVQGGLTTKRPPGGAATDSVVFESTVQDSLNGDDWAGITVTAMGDCSIEDASIGFAKRPVYIAGAADPEIRNSTIHHYSEEGLFAWSSDVLIEGCVVERGEGLDEDLQTTGIRLFQSYGDVHGNNVQWQTDYGIAVGTNAGFCAGPGTGGNPGPVSLVGNRVVGDAETEERQNSAGILAEYLCHGFQATVSADTVEAWAGAGIELYQVSALDVECSLFQESLTNARFETVLSSFSELDPDPADFRGNEFLAARETNFYVRHVGTLRLGDGGSGAEAGKNTLSRLGEAGSYYLAVDFPYFGELSAIQSAWVDDGGSVETDSTTIVSSIDFTGASGVLLAPILTSEDTCVGATEARVGRILAGGVDGRPHQTPQALDGVESSGVPSDWSLKVASNPTTSSSLDLLLAVPSEGSGRVRITAFDVLGRRIATFVDREVAPGNVRATWDLRGNDGTRIAPGIYFVALEAGEVRQTVKVTVTK